MTEPRVGDTAPDFTLEGSAGEEISTFTLSDALEAGPAVLTFYIYDYSPVCTEQICEVDDLEFLTFRDDVSVFGISTDGPYSHREFADEHDISYPLLTDDDRQVYEEFGMTRIDEDGKQVPTRGIVVVDTDRTVRYRWVAGSNWDDWEIAPLEDAVATVERLVGA